MIKKYNVEIKNMTKYAWNLVIIDIDYETKIATYRFSDRIHGSPQDIHLANLNDFLRRNYIMKCRN